MKTSGAILLLAALLGLCAALPVEEVDPPAVKTKPGKCPKDTIQCFQAEVDRCKTDCNCTGDQKCCHFRCGLKCKAPATDTPHDGTCPNILAKCMNTPSDPECSCDSDCLKTQKCCDLCGKKCLEAEIVHAGFCPPPSPFRIGLTCIPSMINNTCQNDSSCLQDEKCCTTGCSDTCVKALTEKPGVCPEVRFSCMMSPLPRTCDSDKDCGGIKKCCRGGCGYGCTDPASTEKLGVCPAPLTLCSTVPPGSPPPPCTKDEHCPGAKKCCIKLCSRECIDVITEKPGQCPISSGRCATVPPPTCKDDWACSGAEKCCTPLCTKECTNVTTVA